MSDNQLIEARAEAKLILGLQDQQLADLFFEKSMSRNLARTVRRLDQLIRKGGDDKDLGASALKRLGFDPI